VGMIQRSPHSGVHEVNSRAHKIEVPTGALGVTRRDWAWMSEGIIQCEERTALAPAATPQNEGDVKNVNVSKARHGSIGGENPKPLGVARGSLQY
jgi:hypothetical protein